MAQVESFTLDHNAVKAPYVRLAGTERHESGALLQKYDMRFLQPIWPLTYAMSWMGS